MKQFKPVILWAVVAFSLTGSVHAQFTASIKTNTINGVHSNWVGNISYIVGSNTFKDVLQILNTGVLSNRNGILGYEVNASNNLAIVNNGIWNNHDVALGDLYVGYNGARNQLIVSNGGQVFSHLGELGVFASSSTNVAVVTGAGSVWSNQVGLYVGNAGSGNQLIVTNGGNMLTADSFVGDNASSSNNLAVVTGPGSVWSNVTVVYLGYNGPGNRLVITNGGKLFGNGVLGYNASSSNNVAVVTDPGSVWDNGSNADFEVGFFAGGNQVIVTNGGTVIDGTGIVGALVGSNNSVRVVDHAVWQNNFTLLVGLSGSSNELTIDGGSVLANNATISANTGSGGNVLRLDSGSLFVTNALGNGVLAVSKGGAGPGELILNGGSITADNLIATNGANSIITLNGGTITVRSAQVIDTQGLVVGGTFVFNGGTATVSQLVLTNPAAAIMFNSGLFQTESTTIANGQQFAIGTGSTPIDFELLGGVHSFNDGLRVPNAAVLTGCGTVTGDVTIDSGGWVFTDCGTLTFTGAVTNNYALAVNGTDLEFYGTVVNNSAILLYNGGTTNFHGSFINNGVVLDAGWVHVSSITNVGNDVVIEVPSVSGFGYQLQISPSMDSPMWTNSGAPQSGTGGVLTFTDPGGATNGPNRYYQVGVIWPP
jgi:T5SS/PEP-CTERM-associated repeat protein